ncbi:hypothetical protein F4813DRAFT_359431 [Daldinia decipiens]|uniref:uncharacterized protein n=1 Tax=Daldinia decipiens TaxID=326647 RepID=UPI0020C1BBE4|nr:uncharacterized protein F4813DRAFT_359431 [Daldinia decipiens]KAI1657751.1 hypothetical protein F4813DRAFT_359431 [Daldinia decipiens]
MHTNSHRGARKRNSTMPSPGKASGVTFSLSPPARVRVGAGFRIRIRAPSNDDNGSMAIVRLVRVSSCRDNSSTGLLASSDLFQGNVVGNWQAETNQPTSNGQQYDIMEFKSLKVNQPGSYYLRIQLYGAPAAGGERSGFHVEHIRNLDSERFYVGT